MNVAFPSMKIRGKERYCKRGIHKQRKFKCYKYGGKRKTLKNVNSYQCIYNEVKDTVKRNKLV